MPEIVISSAAEAEYVEALLWYSAQSKRAAEGFEAVFSIALQAIAENPESYPRCDASHRFLRVRPYPYQVIYRRLADERRLIVAVAHTSRRPRYWKRRD